MVNVINDVAALTTIPNKTLEKLMDKFMYCVSDAVVEAKISGESIIDLDIGIGTLSLKLTDDTVKYKFTPSTNFHDIIKSSVLNERNLLEDKLEQSFIERITNVYKELL